jgi:hypothetical protein
LGGYDIMTLHHQQLGRRLQGHRPSDANSSPINTSAVKITRELAMDTT